jgi:hypothetical protein
MATLRGLVRGELEGRNPLRNRIGRSGEDVVDHPAADVRQAEFATRIPISQTLVVQAERTEERGVQVVKVHLDFDRGETELIGPPWSMPPLSPPPANQTADP